MCYLYAAWLILAHHRGFQDWSELVKLFTDTKSFVSRTKIYLSEKWRDYRIQEYVDVNINEWILLHSVIIRRFVPAHSLIGTIYHRWKNCQEKNQFRLMMLKWIGLIYWWLSVVWSTPTIMIPISSMDRIIDPSRTSEIENWWALNKLNDYYNQLSDNRTDDRTKNRQLLYHSADNVMNGWSLNDGPVGTGKTNANNRAALKIAKKFDCKRIQNVIPFTNIIDQSVKEAKEHSLLLPGEYPLASSMNFIPKLSGNTGGWENLTIVGMAQ